MSEFVRIRHDALRLNIADYIPKTKPTVFSNNKTTESCTRCGVSYEIPIVPGPCIVHNIPEVAKAYDSNRKAELALQDSILRGGETSIDQYRRESTSLHLKRVVDHYVREDDQYIKHLVNERDICRDSHFCDPDVYVPRDIALVFSRDERSLASEKIFHERQEDIRERDNSVREYHREQDRQYRLADETAYNARREVEYLRSRADRDADYSRSRQDRLNDLEESRRYDLQRHEELRRQALSDAEDRRLQNIEDRRQQLVEEYALRDYYNKTSSGAFVSSFSAILNNGAGGLPRRIKRS